MTPRAPNLGVSIGIYNTMARQLIPPEPSKPPALESSKEDSKHRNLPLLSAELSVPASLARSTEEVIKDLKRPLHGKYNGPYSLHKDPVPASTEDLAGLEVIPGLPKQWVPNSNAMEKDEDEDRYEDDDDEDEEESAVPSTKPRKITERKRRENAAAELHMQRFLQGTFKKHKVKAQDTENQSARWLINQSSKEAAPIISTPREYQSELFERAKEKNIIAVLDTG